MVSAVDADGREVAGIRLPVISVPVGTYTGWNALDTGNGRSEHLARFLGMTMLFFSRTEEERCARRRPAPVA